MLERVRTSANPAWFDTDKCFIGGRWVAPTKGQYQVDLSPATGLPFTTSPCAAPVIREIAGAHMYPLNSIWRYGSPAGSPADTGRVSRTGSIAAAANRGQVARAVPARQAFAYGLGTAAAPVRTASRAPPVL